MTAKETSVTRYVLDQTKIKTKPINLFKYKFRTQQQYNKTICSSCTVCCLNNHDLKVGRFQYYTVCKKKDARVEYVLKGC